MILFRLNRIFPKMKNTEATPEIEQTFSRIIFSPVNIRSLKCLNYKFDIGGYIEFNNDKK